MPDRHQMPTYDYRCRECGRDFEVFQRMSDKPGAACPDCGHGAERLISGGAGFLFKGDGFYITDYRSEDYLKKARAEAGGGSEKQAEGKSDGEAGSSGPSDASGAGAAKKGDGGREEVASASGTGSESRGGKGD